eukprot:TRINITY_DN1656_c0_g4_i1.p1 TRINITY_DN1656_c0_g4~~TRINITY_DN1656_c0_g4_i1.p1  ORF type:complete len:168 (-),score=20.06 TRINITY_DN1656_c0_g4_i1:259-762(-)
MEYQFPTSIPIQLKNFPPLPNKEAHNSIIARVLTNYTDCIKVLPGKGINPTLKSFFLSLLCFYSKIHTYDPSKTLLLSLAKSPFYDFLDSSIEGFNFKEKFIPSMLRAKDGHMNRARYIVEGLGSNPVFNNVSVYAKSRVCSVSLLCDCSYFEGVAGEVLQGNGCRA